MFNVRPSGPYSNVNKQPYRIILLRQALYYKRSFYNILILLLFFNRRVARFLFYAVSTHSVG